MIFAYKITIAYIDGSHAIPVWSTFNYSQIIRPESIDGYKWHLLQCRDVEMILNAWDISNKEPTVY